MHFWRNFAKIVSKFWKPYFIRINIPVLSVISILLHHNRVTNVDHICSCSAVSFSLVTHTEVTGLPARSSHSCSEWFVWNQLPRVALKHNLHDVITVPAYSKFLCLIIIFINIEFSVSPPLAPCNFKQFHLSWFVF